LGTLTVTKKGGVFGVSFDSPALSRAPSPMPLTDVAVRAAKPREKSYRIADGQGMYLEVMPTGAKYCRLK
jgi:hypothetical protein